MASAYLIKNLNNPKIQYYVQSGFQAIQDLSDLYGFEAPDYLTFLSQLDVNRQNVINFYDRLDEFGANPFKKKE